MTTIGIMGDNGNSQTSLYCRAVMQIGDQEQRLINLPRHRNGLQGPRLDMLVLTELDRRLPRELRERAYRETSSLIDALNYNGEAVPFAVINVDSPEGARLLEQVRVPYVTYGASKKAHVRASHIRASAHGSSYLLETPVGNCQVELRIPGHKALTASLAAAALGLALRIYPDEIAPALGAAFAQEELVNAA